MNNLAQRTVFGSIYVAIIVASVAFFPAAVPVIAFWAACQMMHEFYKTSIGEKELRPQRIASMACMGTALFINWLSWSGVCGHRLLIVALVPLALVFIFQMFGKERFNISGLSYIFYALVWVGLPVAFLPVICIDANGDYYGWLLLSFFILIWCSDVGAYCLGSVLGQRPGARRLAPAISPKKSWWGVAGGVILCVGCSVVLYYTGLLKLPLAHCIAMSAVLSIASVAGDLMESLWKRSFDIKDSGNLIPGHGGMLDRLDSSIFAMPLATVYLILFNLI